MKWRNFNLAIRIKLSAGTKVLIFVVCVFILLGLSCASQVIEKKFDAAVLALGAALSIGLYEGYKNNRLDVDVAEKGIGEKLNAVKTAAAGVPNGNTNLGKTGDPLA